MSYRSTYSQPAGGGYAGHSRYTPLTSYSGMPGSNEMRGTDIIAEYLLKERVPYILGYAGHGATGLLDGIVKVKDRIRHISPRIEQAAGFMADFGAALFGLTASRAAPGRAGGGRRRRS